MIRKIDPSLFLSMVGDFLTVYLVKESACSAHTRKTYTSNLVQFRKYVTEVKRISIKTFRFKDITYDFVLEYRNWLLEEKHLQPTTINNRLATLRTYLNYAAKRDISLQQMALSTSEVPSLREPVKTQPVLGKGQTQKLLALPKNTKLGRRDSALLTVLFDCAVRADELMKLSLRDVTLEGSEPHIHVNGKGNKDRDIVLDDAALAVLKAYVAEFHEEADYDKPFFFTVIHGKTNHMSISNVERIVKKYADILREEDSALPNVTPHTFRRTRATGMYQDGVDISLISKILGHSGVEVTARHYAFPSYDQKKEAMEKGKVCPTRPEESQEWPEDDAEFARQCGLG